MIYHIALPEDWQEAQVSGIYTVSTRGRTLADEGFIHASDTAEQVEAVRQFVYDDLDELLLLTIDESRLAGQGGSGGPARRRSAVPAHLRPAAGLGRGAGAAAVTLNPNRAIGAMPRPIDPAYAFRTSQRTGRSQ